MINSNNSLISSLHHTYRTLTGFDIKMDFSREHQWYDWIKRGHEEKDLVMVINYLKSEIKKGNRNLGALKFHNLISMCDYFEEDLQMAKAQARKPKVDHERASVLRATGRPTHHDKPPRTAAQVLADQEAFKAFRAFKESL